MSCCGAEKTALPADEYDRRLEELLLELALLNRRLKAGDAAPGPPNRSAAKTAGCTASRPRSVMKRYVLLASLVLFISPPGGSAAGLGSDSD